MIKFSTACSLEEMEDNYCSRAWDQLLVFHSMSGSSTLGYGLMSVDIRCVISNGVYAFKLLSQHLKYERL